MAEPLSIASGVIGVVTAAVEIISLLTKFTKTTIAAPQQAQVVLTEVSDIGGILSHLQSFLLGLGTPNGTRTSLLKVEKVLTIVSGCVLTFSELEKLLDELKTEDLGVLDCLKWARKESAIVGLIQRLQNHKVSLSLVLNILNGFVPICQMLLSAWVLIFRRQTIIEAKDSVDRLHALVEKCYKEMSSRVQALEDLGFQKRESVDWMSGDETESLATIHAHPPGLKSEESIDSEIVRFDFLDDLERSRVYRRNKAFRKSVISALTNSVYSLGWSFLSDLSMAEVSNISVINLGVTEGETFNPRRSSQTWSAQPNDRTSTGLYTNNYRDGEFSQLNRIVRKPVPANRSAIAQGHWAASTLTQQQSLPEGRSLPTFQPLQDRHSILQSEEHMEKNARVKPTDDPAPTSTLPPREPIDPISPSQVQTTSSPRHHELAEDESVPSSGSSGFPESLELDEAAYPCKGCGEVCFTPSCCVLAKPPLVVGQSAND